MEAGSSHEDSESDAGRGLGGDETVAVGVQLSFYKTCCAAICGIFFKAHR